MNKEQFFRELEECLQGEVSNNELAESMAYYRDYFRSQEAANFGKEPVCLNLETPIHRVILSNQKNLPKPEQSLKLESCEVIVAECVED